MSVLWVLGSKNEQTIRKAIKPSLQIPKSPVKVLSKVCAGVLKCVSLGCVITDFKHFCPLSENGMTYTFFYHHIFS